MNARTPLDRLMNAFRGAYPSAAPTKPLTEPGLLADEPLATPARVRVQRATRPLVRNEVMLDALTRAMAEFVSNEACVYVARDERARFLLEQVTALITPENRMYLNDMATVKRNIRNKIAMKCIMEAEGAAQVIDCSKFVDLNIAPAADASNDDASVYTVLAGSGPEQVSISFEIYGDYVEVEEDAYRPDRAPSNDSTETLEAAGTATTLLHLTVREPDKSPRTLDITQLPLLIGRGSTCGARLDSGYVSRVHACVRADASGQLVLENHSPKGTRLDGSTPKEKGQTIAQGQSQALPLKGSMTLAAMAGTNAVHIDFEQVHTAADAAATLELPADTASVGTEMVMLNRETSMPIQYLGGEQPATIPTGRQSTGSGPAGAPETLYSARPALARLHVRHGDGSTDQVLIQELPFVLGREPAANNALALTDPQCRASREHLRIDKLQGGAFITENLATGPGKGGTWCKGEAMGQRFSWRVEAPGSQTGWYVLGQRAEGAGAVMVRLERAQ